MSLHRLAIGLITGMRLFTGLAMPAEVEASIDAFVRMARAMAPGWNWSPLENLHITTKFIGEWPEADLDRLQQALAQAAAECRAMRVAVRGIGWFPNPHQPRALFATVDGAQALQDLASRTDGALAQIGVAAEDRPYRPHVTLARLRTHGAELSEVRRAIAASASLDFGEIAASSFGLYSSRPGSRGSVYTKLAEFPLT